MLARQTRSPGYGYACYSNQLCKALSSRATLKDSDFCPFTLDTPCLGSALFACQLITAHDTQLRKLLSLYTRHMSFRNGQEVARIIWNSIRFARKRWRKRSALVFLLWVSFYMLHHPHFICPAPAECVPFKSPGLQDRKVQHETKKKKKNTLESRQRHL